MAPEYRASELAKYIEITVKPYNAEYTKRTGKLPPHPFQEPPTNIETWSDYFLLLDKEAHDD